MTKDHHKEANLQILFPSISSQL